MLGRSYFCLGDLLGSPIALCGCGSPCRVWIWLWRQSEAKRSPRNSLFRGKEQGICVILAVFVASRRWKFMLIWWLTVEIPLSQNREIFRQNSEIPKANSEISASCPVNGTCDTARRERSQCADTTTGAVSPLCKPLRQIKKQMRQRRLKQRRVSSRHRGWLCSMPLWARSGHRPRRHECQLRAINRHAKDTRHRSSQRFQEFIVSRRTQKLAFNTRATTRSLSQCTLA